MTDPGPYLIETIREDTHRNSTHNTGNSMRETCVTLQPKEEEGVSLADTLAFWFLFALIGLLALGLGYMTR